MLHTREDAFFVGLAWRDNVVEDRGKCVRGGGDRRESPKTGSQVAEIQSKIRLTVIQKLGGLAQSHGKAGYYPAGFHGEDSSTTDPIVRTKPQPGGKGRTGRMLGDVGAVTE